MKLVKLLQSFVILCAFSNLLSAQTAPNQENGFKPYGSYEGSHLDTVNLMNGNVIFHAPLMLETPQRGSLNVANTLYSTSQDWQVVCNPGCKWAKGGAGVFVEFSPFLKVHRTLDMNHVYDNIAVQYAYNYTIITQSGSVHKLHGVAGTEDQYGEPTQFDSIDLTGFHLTMSGPDSSGVLRSFTVTDRSGNKFEGTIPGGHCTKAGNYLTSGGLTGGVHAPMQDDASVGEQYCSETGITSLVTDRNGNQISNPDTGPFLDTLGKSPLLLGGGGSTTDFSDCVSPYAITSTWSNTYQDPNGVSQKVKTCFSNLPIQTAFNVSGVAEDASSSDWQFLGLMSVVYPDKTYWGFTYDNYGELASIHLPTGGSISYDWETVNYLGCSNGQAYPYSRAVKTRTLDDGRGHTSVWHYNWGTISGGLRVNTVTDPAGNDIVHTFTDLSGAGGLGPSCTFYETTTVQYQGASSANNIVQRTDTSYSSTSMLTDDGTGNSSLGNIFATDVITTVYPNSKVKKVHKDPDPGLGAGLPGFGNTIKELDYDWGQGAPGPLLRETDTVYQWQKADTSGNKPYLAAHLLDLPASTVTISPTSAANTKSNCPLTVTTTGNCMAETDYSYDEPAYLTAASITTQHIAAPWSVRGNPTTVSHWLSTGSTWTSSHTNWYDTGEAYQQIDPLGHTATHSYDAAYVGAYSTQTCSPSTSGVAHCVSGTYDSNSGLLTSLTNENATTQASGNTQGDSAHTSNYGYDSMLRLTSAQGPPDPANGSVRAQTSFNFPTTNVFPFNVQRTKSITASLTDSTTSYFDGLGRVYQSQHVLPNGTSTVDTTFDDVHSQVTATNPYFSTSDPTYGSTTTLSDPLGRGIQVTKQDGSISKVGYSVITGAHDAVVGANTVGDCTDTTDEAGKLRRTCTDGLGRLVQVVEPNPGATATDASGSVVINGNEQASTQSGAYGSAQITVSGQEASTQVCVRSSCHTVYDTGKVSVSVNGYLKTANYGQGSNSSTVAAALRDAFHNDTSSPVDASCSDQFCTNPTITLTARTQGVATNYALACSSTADDYVDFTPPSFSPGCPAALTGGRDPLTTPDSGSVTITLNGTNYSTTYGGGDTTATIAQRLASAISGGTQANGAASGSTVTITTKTGGTSTNYSLAASYTWNNAGFTNPSFTTSTSSSVLTGGYDASVLDNQPYVTLYQYDALGNLLRVDQKGTAPNDSTQWRTRTFTYDSLSRLITANNPESGTISYSYDADGSLLQKTSPAPNQTGTATQTVSYCYDELHRVTGKGYGAQTCPLATPVVTYAYDSGTNAIGKLTSLTDQAGTASYTYDILGRLAAETRTLTGANNASISKNLSYEYNLDGSLYKLHYPSGNVVTYEPGAAGLTLSAKDTGNGINYVTSATYGPDSALTGFISGYSTSFAGITNTFSYNKRLQPLNMSANAPGQTVFSIGYDFHLGNGTSGADNGNVFSITNYKDTTRNQTFTYDALNRLISAQNAGADCTVNVLGGNKKFWGNTYTYDAWGNLVNKTKIGTACAGENLSLTADAHNWLHATGGPDYQYDAAGNMTFNATPPTQNYTYDQENRLTGAAGYAYTYDADGNRVIKSNGSTGTLYWYMTPGIVGESDLSGNLTDEYVFFDGARVARKSTNGVFYDFSDHLKTASVITDAAGNIKSESDFYPWGGELQFVANDSNHYKFTGKERDGETQLDYFGARYYSNGLGRWVSADWSPTPIPVPYADFHDPQSLNLYGFVGGNPASKTDPDGHCCSPREVVDFVGGVAQGIVSSASWGAVGAPKFSDSNASLYGQLAGTVIEGSLSTDLAVGGGSIALLGAPETGGGSLVVGGTAALVGVVGAVGAAKNTGAILNAMSNKGGQSNQTGSYTNTHASGKTYSGKGGQGRSQDSGKRVEKKTGDKHTATDWKPSDNDREAFKDESRRIDANGGAASSGTHNQIESPGKKYRKQDGSK